MSNNNNVRKAKITSTAFGHYHDLDPYKVFPTKTEAIKDRSAMFKQPDAKSRSPRVSTFYTILQDKRKNDPQKFGSVPQGPHTFPHHGLHRAIVQARKNAMLDVLAPLVPSPAEYDQSVDAEVSSTHLKAKRAEIAKTIFKKRHARFAQLSAMSPRTDAEDLRMSHVMMKLWNQDPYASYGYKGNGAGKGALKGKGESAKKPLANQIDLPKQNGLKRPFEAVSRNDNFLKTFKKVKVE